jgi:hypothetical protein
MVWLLFEKIYICQSCYLKCIVYFTKNIVVKPRIRPDIWPDIRYPALIGYPVSSFWISRISGWPDIRQKQYPVHPYFLQCSTVKPPKIGSFP